MRQFWPFATGIGVLALVGSTARRALTNRSTAALYTGATELPVTPEIGRAVGALLGSTGLPGATVDAVVAAAALRETGSVLLVTSEPSGTAKSHRESIRPSSGSGLTAGLIIPWDVARLTSLRFQGPR